MMHLERDLQCMLSNKIIAAIDSPLSYVSGLECIRLLLLLDGGDHQELVGC